MSTPYLFGIFPYSVDEIDLLRSLSNHGTTVQLDSRCVLKTIEEFQVEIDRLTESLQAARDLLTKYAESQRYAGAPPARTGGIYPPLPIWTSGTYSPPIVGSEQIYGGEGINALDTERR